MSESKLSPELTFFLNQESIPCYIDGGYPSTGDGVHSVKDPGTGADLARVSYASKSDVDTAVDAAVRAQKIWGQTTSRERAELLRKLADRLDQEQKNLAILESLDVGKALEHADGFDIPFGTNCFRFFADICERSQDGEPLKLDDMDARVHRAPYGVCGFIFPWNFPYLLFCWGVAPALAAGNTVVIKASEVTPLTSLYLASIFESVGFPKGVVNIMTGTGPVCGQGLAESKNISRMSFTGSSQIGRLIGKICGENLVPAKLELGGKGAAVVLQDADLEHTVEGLTGAITLNSGQVCCTATRWYVHDDMYDDFVDLARSKLQSIKIGHGLSEGVGMGPLVSQNQWERVRDYYNRGLTEGAQPLVEMIDQPMDTDAGGYYMTPHLLGGDESNICCREEVFGPTAFVIKYNDEKALPGRIHELRYGLANSIWSKDIDKAQSMAEDFVVGNVWINAHNVFAYGLPYGGINLSGVGGGVNSIDAFNDYRRSTTIARPS